MAGVWEALGGPVGRGHGWRQLPNPAKLGDQQWVGGIDTNEQRDGPLEPPPSIVDVGVGSRSLSLRRPVFGAGAIQVEPRGLRPVRAIGGRLDLKGGRQKRPRPPLDCGPHECRQLVCYHSDVGSQDHRATAMLKPSSASAIWSKMQYGFRAACESQL